jgi:hypothetical protein
MRERKRTALPHLSNQGGFCGTSHPPDRKFWARVVEKSLNIQRPMPTAAERKESLTIELRGIEAMLRGMEDQQTRSVTPFITPKHIVLDRQILSERAEVIRGELGIEL